MKRNRLRMIIVAILMTSGLSSCFFRDRDEHRERHDRGRREHREGRGEHHRESKHDGDGDRK